jgi:hypothetical protein
VAAATWDLRRYQVGATVRFGTLDEWWWRIIQLGSENPLDGRETIRVYFTPFMKRGDSVVFDHDDVVKVASNPGRKEPGVLVIKL